MNFQPDFGWFNGAELLFHYPVQVPLVLLLLCVIWLPPFRERAEKVLGYNNSESSRVGVWFLCFAIALVGQRLGQLWVIDGPAGSSHFHMLVAGIAVLIGIGMWAADRHGKISDQIHNLVVVPLMGYFWVAAMAVVVYDHRELSDLVWFWGCTGVWIGCFVYDARTGRLQQFKFMLEKLGVDPNQGSIQRK